MGLVVQIDIRIWVFGAVDEFPISLYVRSKIWFEGLPIGAIFISDWPAYDIRASFAIELKIKIKNKLYPFEYCRLVWLFSIDL